MKPLDPKPLEGNLFDLFKPIYYETLLKGSWDLVTWVKSKVAILYL